MKVDLSVYKQETEKELDDILSYWIKHAMDMEHGGFYGKIDNENRTYPDSPKGSVLNSRILWAFSAAYNLTKKHQYLVAAKRACDYTLDHFIDNQYGGVYWSVDYTGKMLDGRKQIYGLAFCIYGLSEYYKSSGDKNILQAAVELFKKIEQYSFDKNQKGYYEAFSRDWELLADLRLSNKDANEKKTMNTHLHIIEAYSNLFEVWADEWLKTQIENLLEVFLKYIIDPKTGHLNLFFDEQWNKKLNIISYGHDIEAAWLLLQCAEKIKSHKFIEETKKTAITVTNALAEGLDGDGGLWYEFDKDQNHLILEKHSWPQAEAMIGFMNAYQISQDETYLEKSFNSWQFIKHHIKDTENGEWFWGVNQDNSIMQGKDKAGFWKCPYHNTRACLEIINRIP